jgi:Protein of unknown function (DUF2911)
MLSKANTWAVGVILYSSLTAGAQTTSLAVSETSPSPLRQSSAMLNSQKITVDYSAPSLRGRKILGELIPVGTVWRTGDNAATTLTTPIDLKIRDLYVPAGTYSVYSIVTKKGYQLIINKQTGQSGAEYDQSQDLGRTLLNTNDTDGPIEQLVIDFENTHDNKTELHIKWGYSESWLHINAQQAMQLPK